LLILFIPSPALSFIRELGDHMHARGLVFVLVIPPKQQGQPHASFGHNLIEFLDDSVDYYSLMTYDYSHAGKPGPNAPIDWVRCVLAIQP
jgi:chitinase domain-containing protein 1